MLSLPTINYASYSIVNLTSQKLTKDNSYVTNAYNRQMKVDIYRLHEKLLKPGKLTMGQKVSQVLELMRKTSNVPVIMLTVIKEKAAVLATLSTGADDYVRKPFDQEILLARIQAKLKRTATGL